jgi:hypothetical protein
MRHFDKAEKGKRNATTKNATCNAKKAHKKDIHKGNFSHAADRRPLALKRSKLFHRP